MQPLSEALLAITGPRGLLTGADVLARSSDPLRNLPTRATAIARPADTRELSQILAQARKLPTLSAFEVASGSISGPFWPSRNPRKKWT